MLEGLDAVNWKKYKGGYGITTELPKCIREMASLDETIRNRAYNIVAEEINHQDTIYEVTPYVVPFLIELLADQNTLKHRSLLSMLFDLVFSCNLEMRYITEFTDMRLPDISRTYQNIAKGFSLYRRLTLHKDSTVRLLAVLLIASFPEYAAAGRHDLRHVIKVDTDGQIRAAAIFYLSKLLPLHRSYRALELSAHYFNFFNRIAESCSDSLSRLAAASALAMTFSHYYREDVPAYVLNVLIDGYIYPFAPRPLFSWYVEAPFAPIHAVLNALLQLKYPALALTLQAPELSSQQAHNVTRELLETVFERKHVGLAKNQWQDDPPSAKWADFAPRSDFEDTFLYRLPSSPRYISRNYTISGILNGEQRDVITAIVACDPFWELPTNLFSFFYGLPDSREELQALVQSNE